MLEGEHSYQRGQENLVPSNNSSSTPESPVTPKDQEKPWYIQHFTKLLISFGLGGGAIAILLPWMLWLLCGMSSGSSDQLRLHLLYVTGGVIAVLTLLQTNWKNQGDRIKIDADIKKNEQDAEKNERDHIRQVHAERRSRYTKAVEQLADAKASVRIGGIYTLVGLVDEWLADSTLELEEQQKEGQVIINNLCAYIRSPFLLAMNRDIFEVDDIPEEFSEKLLLDQANFHEEQEVRQTIFNEISLRVERNTSSTSLPEKTVWESLTFDFSRSTIFYPLDEINFMNANFSDSKFIGRANFRFSKFWGESKFNKSSFFGDADFCGSQFQGPAKFIYSTFQKNTWFNGAKFKNSTIFGGSTFLQITEFLEASFRGETNFSGADFFNTTFFSNAKFLKDTDFSGTIFHEMLFFARVHFNKYSDFYKTTFLGDTTFFGTEFVIPTTFNNTQFSYTKKHTFTEEQKISCGNVPLGFSTMLTKDKKFLSRAIIPAGSILISPASWDEELGDYTHLGSPAL